MLFAYSNLLSDSEMMTLTLKPPLSRPNFVVNWIWMRSHKIQNTLRKKSLSMKMKCLAFASGPENKHSHSQSWQRFSSSSWWIFYWQHRGLTLDFQFLSLFTYSFLPFWRTFLHGKAIRFNRKQSTESECRLLSAVRCDGCHCPHPEP